MATSASRENCCVDPELFPGFGGKLHRGARNEDEPDPGSVPPEESLHRGLAPGPDEELFVSLNPVTERG